MLAPIISDKHEITWSNLVQDAGTTKDSTNLVVAVKAGNANLANEVIVGTKITSFYVEMHFSAETVTNPKVIHWRFLIKRTGQTISNPNTYYQTDRSVCLKRGMEMLPKDVSTVYKRVFVIKVPRFLQRMKNDTEVVFEYQCSSTEAINACGFAIYKALN